jgi:polyisoprenoid-binding protein YceI
MSSIRKTTAFAFFTLVALASSAALAEPARPGAYAVDPVHTFVFFKVQHFGAGYTYGQFKDVQGKFVLDADPARSSLDLSIKTASVDTNNAKRDGHLQSPDFFNAAMFPAITFKSTKVAKAADGSLDVTGDLTIRGKTKSVTAKVAAVGAGEDPQKKYRAGFEGKASINRQDFDVSFMKGLLGDSVEITLGLEGVAQ